MEFLTNFWNNQPTTVMGIGVAIFVLLGIYISLLQTYQQTEKFTLINTDRSRIKVFEPFENISKPFQYIDAMMISYGCVYKRLSKPVMKGSKVETVESEKKNIRNY